MKTIFDRIIDRTIPATIIFENEHVIAFFDIAPQSLGHTLVVPKKKYRWIDDMPDNELSFLMVQAKHIIKAQKKALTCDYVQLEIIGKDVPHVHIHLIPRTLTEDTQHKTPAQYDEQGPLSSTSYAQAIISAL